MSAARLSAAYRGLREAPLWRLLSATNAPVYTALLQAHLLDADKSLPASVFVERVSADLQALRASGDVLPQTAQAYIAEWLSQGWVTRRFPAGSSEEEYELSVDAATAIRFVSSLAQPRQAATESRLSTVIHQLTKLAEDTDTNPQTRVAGLMAERERIDRLIETVQRGGFTPLPEERAIERAREVISLADELANDFRRVRDEFDLLNRQLRERLMDSEGSRGDVLDTLFDGVDLVARSDAGRTFTAFWKLLTDLEQTAILEDALSQVVQRPFARRLEVGERRFLLRMTRTLLEEGGSVHDVLQNFARSLKTFVQSREFLEHRRLLTLLKEAQRAALDVKENVLANRVLDYSLVLTSSRIRSLSQWVLYDPADRMAKVGMPEGDSATIDLETVGELLRNSEIDFRGLKENIRAALSDLTQVSIGQLIEKFPAEQGLGTVVGYVALGARHGEQVGATETVVWDGLDGTTRRARIPTIYFLREKLSAIAE